MSAPIDAIKPLSFSHFCLHLYVNPWKKILSPLLKFKTFLSGSQQELDEKTGECLNYPTENFESFNDCVGGFIEKTLPDGLIPFWSTSNLSLATEKYFVDEKTQNHDIIENHLGIVFYLISISS